MGSDPAYDFSSHNPDPDQQSTVRIGYIINAEKYFFALKYYVKDPSKVRMKKKQDA